MRLIDANDFRYKLQCEHIPSDSLSASTVNNMIADAPTVDAVPVVRCSQCAFCDRTPCPARDPETGKTRNCMKYCSVGERKDGKK